MIGSQDLSVILAAGSLARYSEGDGAFRSGLICSLTPPFILALPVRGDGRGAGVCFRRDDAPKREHESVCGSARVLRSGYGNVHPCYRSMFTLPVRPPPLPDPDPLSFPCSPLPL